MRAARLQAVRRSHHRALVFEGSARSLRGQEEPSPSDRFERQGRQRLRLQARGRRSSRADARHAALRRFGASLRDGAQAHFAAGGRSHVCLERRPLREVQHHRLRSRRHDARRGRRPDEPRRLRPHRGPQGRRGWSFARRVGGGFRRLLPVPRRARRCGGRRLHGRHPAGRLHP